MTDNANGGQINAIVTKYIQLRDAKKALDDKHKAKMEVLVNALDKMEAVLLIEFNRMGVDSISARGVGTAYRNTRTSARVMDWDSTLEFIKDNEAWDMLKKDVAKSAVEAYREENNNVPPGIEWREEVTINVRRD
jgi:hypothetical protein